MGSKFFGTYSRSLDTKGRLQIPAKLLVEPGDTLYMLRGFEGCISIYDEDGFHKLLQKLESLDFEGDEEARAYIRLTASSVNPMKLDAHGRILIGKQILSDYQIGEDVTIIGVLDHFEVWDPTAFAKYQFQHSLGFGHHSTKGRN